MINEIKGSPVNVVQNLSNSQTDRLQSESGNRQSEGDSTDKSDVTITTTAEKLRALEAEIQSQPVVDTQRVQAIKKSIFDGTFNFDSGRTADKMAEFENLLTSESTKD